MLRKDNDINLSHWFCAFQNHRASSSGLSGCLSEGGGHGNQHKRYRHDYGCVESVCAISVQLCVCDFCMYIPLWVLCLAENTTGKRDT